MASKHRYEKIDKSQVPERVSFRLPRPNAGQIVEVQYGDWDWYTDEFDRGSPYQRVVDHSVGGEWEYFRLVGDG